MSLSGMPRPLKFNSLNEFVMGNSQNFEQSYQNRSPKSGVFMIRSQESLYDRYNVNNLLLQKVNKNHLQILTKNIVLDEEDINPNKIFSQTNFKGTNLKNFNQTVGQKSQQMTKLNNFMQTNMTGGNIYNESQQLLPKKEAAKTSQGFYVQKQRESKEYSQNELLFNFNKIAEQKKAKKKQFLDTIEAKLNQIQLEAKQLQQCQFEEAIQIRQIEKIKGELGRELTQNSFKGKLTQKVYQNIQQQESDNQDYQKPKSLHINMSPVEINHVLSGHFEENQKLLDQIIRVKSKSKERSLNQSPGKSKQFQKTSISNNGFNKTSISQNKKSLSSTQTQKKIMSATTKLPPKHGRK